MWAASFLQPAPGMQSGVADHAEVNLNLILTMCLGSYKVPLYAGSCAG